MPAHALLRLCVVADDDAWQAVTSTCNSQFSCTRKDLDGLEPVLHEDGAWFDALAGAAAAADAVLVAWDIQHAPLLAALARRLRSAPTPLVALCASVETDCVAALSVGADLVHPMPPSAALLKAQVIAHRRGHALQPTGEYGDRMPVPARAGRYAPARAQEPGARVHRRVEAGPLVVDLTSYTASVGADPVELTPLQLQVLALLVEHAGSVLSRDEFLNRIWGFDFETGTNIVDVHMHYIRRALRDRGFDGAVKTIRGVGYRLDVEPRTGMAA
jgi:DNA-binding response OmpR family regulator